jgi:hypothetical protein
MIANFHQYALELLFAFSPRLPTQVYNGQIDGPGFVDHLNRGRSFYEEEGRTEDLVALDDDGESILQRDGVERSLQPNCHPLIVQSRIGIQLAQKPDAFLSDGKRCSKDKLRSLVAV